MPTMTPDVALVTNVLVYMVSADVAKATVSEALVRAGGIVSAQVLNEFTHVLKRKFRATWPQIDVQLAAIRSTCRIVPVTVDVHDRGVHDRGLEYAERYMLQVHDSMIVAAAVLAGCAVLLSEDMHNGLVIDGLTIRNPYSP